MASFSSIGFIGSGRLARTLAQALAAAGEAVVAVAGRTETSASLLAAQVPGCRAVDAEQAVALADLVFITVPDDAIAAVASALPWRAGQAVVHCSGATPLEALAAARNAGAAVGGFHPLQIFSDPEAALRTLPGSSVAIEAAAPSLHARLLALAEALQLCTLSLPPGARPGYHAAANLAASFLLSTLDEAVQVLGRIGMSPDDALQALLPLARGTLEAARTKGLAGAVSGPISRGDAAVVAAHLKALDALGGDHGAFYRALALRQLPMAGADGRLDEPGQQQLRALLTAQP